MIKRDGLIFFIILLAFAALAVKAFYVQILNTNFLQQEADKRQIRTVSIPAPRGEIYDRHGRLVALSTPIGSVWLDPKVVGVCDEKYQQVLELLQLSDDELNHLAEQNRLDRLSFIRQLDDSAVEEIIRALALPGIYIKRVSTEYSTASKHIVVDEEYASLWVDTSVLNRYRYTLDKLANLLKKSRKELAGKVYKHPKSRFMYVQRGVVPDVVNQIEMLGLRGVYVDKEYKRYYPSSEIFANLIGFTDINDVGIEGVENAYNTWLSGEPGKKQVIKDRSGKVIDFIKDVKAAEPGRPMVLSIDQDLQFFTFRALKKVMIKHQAKSASSVILDVKTGEILAMVSLPSFNPNDVRQRKGVALKNRTVTDLIEPGSTMKPFIVAKALDEGTITLDTVIDTHQGVFKIRGQKISDTRNHGPLTPGQVIQKSSNIGAAKIALTLTAEQQRNYWESMGFGQPSGLFLTGENSGYLRPYQQWKDVDQAFAAFGYGFNTNVMALAHAYQMLANKGVSLPINLVKQEGIVEGRPVITPETAQKVLEMMESVVGEGGTAKKARIRGFRVAGKTGTVHKTKKKGGYKENTYMSLFAGVVPVSDPSMVMVILVNEPSRGVYYGGQVAAPVFSEVMKEALRIRKIKSDAKVSD